MQAPSYPVFSYPVFSRHAARLREEVSLRALAWAEAKCLAHECTIGRSPNVIFRENPDGTHGNFQPAAYRRIQARPEWNMRLHKVHTSASRRLASHDGERRELDTAVSSDALLMNVFCHPGAFSRGSALRMLLGTDTPERLQFGFHPRVPLHSHHVERTEIDLKIGNLLIEAKLTEADFQRASLERLECYRDLHDVFDAELLPKSGEFYLHYQLVRGVLAAHAAEDFRYCVICDARRPDLLDAWFSVASAVKPAALRSRLQIVTWQEIAATLPAAMQKWLAGKYGIACGV